jgi:hypothetical protein
MVNPGSGVVWLAVVGFNASYNYSWSIGVHQGYGDYMVPEKKRVSVLSHWYGTIIRDKFILHFYLVHQMIVNGELCLQSQT